MSASASPALEQFLVSLKTAQELIRIETRLYHDPPRPEEIRAVEGLRGGAAILMVAGFEAYLRQFALQEMTKLATPAARVVFQKLPDDVRVHSVFTTLEAAMRGPAQSPRSSRLGEITAACNDVLSEILNVEGFADTGGNPSGKMVREFFKHWGITNVYVLTNVQFMRKWGAPMPPDLVLATLDSVVQRRHSVAHTAVALNISRVDLRDGVRFLRVFSKCVDIDVRKYMKNVLRTAR